MTDITPENVVRVLRKAARMIDALAPKDIRKSFAERNFAENTLRTLADALSGAPPKVKGEG